MKSPTPLDRRYIFIQIKAERNHATQAVVPFHPEIFNLNESILTDEKMARDSLSIAKNQFEEETRTYIRSLENDMRAQGKSINPSLKLDKYGHFDDSWSFDFLPCGGIMLMIWEPGGDKTHKMSLVPEIVMISNGILTGKGKRPARIEEIEFSPNVTVMYGSIHMSDYVLFSPEMMSEYECLIPDKVPGFEEEGTITEILHRASNDENDRVLDVSMNAFCSDYLDNVPQALLLRDWAVEYHNRLLKEVKPKKTYLS